MSVEIPITGIPEEISEIKRGNVIFLEGGEDSLARFLAHRIVYEHGKSGQKGIIISSRPEVSVSKDLRMVDSKAFGIDIYEGVSPQKFQKAFSQGSLVIIDSLDHILDRHEISDPHRLFENLILACKQTSSILILVSRHGRLEPRIESILKHNVDGIIQMKMIERPEGISRFIRVEKWTNGIPYDDNIPFKFYNNRFNIDLRSKVV